MSRLRTPPCSFLSPSHDSLLSPFTFFKQDPYRSVFANTTKKSYTKYDEIAKTLIHAKSFIAIWKGINGFGVSLCSLACVRH
jgi:hypothetical protein